MALANIVLGRYQKSIILIVISYLSTTLSQLTNQTLIYTQCSSTYCTTCLNSYQCQVCQFNNQPLCCPKYCIQCLDMTHCIQCELDFILRPYNGSFICTRVYSQTDPYKDANNNCVAGHYLDNATLSCLDCNFPNCKTCPSYQNCTICASTFYLTHAYITVNNSNSSSGNIFINQTLIIIQSICLNCLPNCNTCPSSSVCTTCISEFFLNPTNTSCIRCQIVNCATCKNQTACVACIGIALLNTTTNACQTCSSKIKYCWSCGISTLNPTKINCTQCEYGYYPDPAQNNTVCTPCPPNCQFCGINSGTSKLQCFNCSINYTTDSNNNCIQCGVGCLVCNGTLGQLNCSYCSYGYQLQVSFNNITFSISAQCVKCQFPCQECSNVSNACEQCITGFYINYQAGTSNNVTELIGQCYFCNIQNCLACNTSASCSLCQDGYVIKFSLTGNTDVCSPCPLNCTLCQSDNSSTFNSNIFCTSCTSGHVLDKTKNKNPTACTPCKVANCAICNSTNISMCLQCKPGYVVDGAFDCDSCSIAYCDICLYNDNTGQQILTCLNCVNGFYLQNNQSTGPCLACPSNCLYCLNGSYCKNCQEHYYIVSNQSAKTQSCSSCPVQCLRCNSNGCLYCSDGFYPSPEQSVTINSTTIVTCLQCASIPGCVSCYNNQYCQQCTEAGYSTIPTIFGTCAACPAGCTTCDQTLECSLCEEGYLLNTQTNTCLDENGFAIWQYFIVCTFGIALLFVLTEKIIRRVLRTKEKQKKLNEQGQGQGQEGLSKAMIQIPDQSKSPQLKDWLKNQWIIKN